MELRDYQERFVKSLSTSLITNRKIVAQLATGGGKTVCFSAICDRYIKKSGKSVLILVHRKELLKQASNSLLKCNGIYAQSVIAGMKHIPPAPVYVAMIETAYKRLDQFRNIGMIIIDECHLGNFTKVIDYFQDQFIIGFTATPLAAKKSNPLRNYFDNIVTGVDIPELIESGFLCNEITYGAKETVDRASLKMKMGEFDEKQMASEFSNPKYVEVTVNAYKKYSINRKTIVFNCNVEHSILVSQAFLSAGFNCKHLDANSKDRERTLEWFDATQDAILCNVGIATTGFDQPDIETVIVNKATASMPLWLQMCGRGARTHYIKQAFTIIDLGGNCITHGQWSEKRDWLYIFNNPPKKGNGIAPLKSCDNCDAMVHTRIMVCPYCLTPFPVKVLEEEEITEFILMSDTIDVKLLIEKNDQYKLYYSFFLISKELARQAKTTITEMNDETYEVIKQKNIELGRLWCREQMKKWNSSWYGERIEETLTEELKKHYTSWRKY
jgi:superfamily II DNA or RNA helicase